MIDANEIHEMLVSSMFKKEEIRDGKPLGAYIVVEGVVNTFGLHPERLEANRPRLKEIIGELDPKFLLAKPGSAPVTESGGWTFLNLPFDKDGAQWGEQINGEELICLCMGLGMADYCMPREMWDVLPGGVPYVVFNPEGTIPGVVEKKGPSLVI